MMCAHAVHCCSLVVVKNLEVVAVFLSPLLSSPLLSSPLPGASGEPVKPHLKPSVMTPTSGSVISPLQRLDSAGVYI